MMWEILGWVTAGWLILIVSALAVAMIVAIVRGISKPTTTPKTTGYVNSDSHTIFKG